MMCAASNTTTKAAPMTSYSYTLILGDSEMAALGDALNGKTRVRVKWPVFRGQGSQGTALTC